VDLLLKIQRKGKMQQSGIVVKLYEEYYVKNAFAETKLSSHWKEYSKNFKVTLDSAGLPAQIEGYGFGDLQIHSFPYQVLSLLAILLNVLKLSDRSHVFSTLASGWRLARRTGLGFTLDAFRQVCTLSLIRKYLSEKQQHKRIYVLIIGDGYGLLGSLFKDIFPKSTIVLADIGKVLLFQAYYSQKAHPDKIHELTLKDGEIDPSKCDFVYCPSELLSKVSSLTYDVAISVASMQEMSIDAVTDYFRYLRQHMDAEGLFYCGNRERKVLVGGEVREFAHYPWHPEEVHLVDEPCPWHNYYLSFATNSNGPRMLGVRIPFVNYYDGPTWHRLTRLRRVE